MQQITRVLSDKEEYRQQMLKGYGTFMRRYPLLLRGALVVGIAVPLITGVMVHMSVGAKVVVLSLWLASLVLLLVFLSVVENARENFESQLDLGAMEEKDLQGLFVLSRFGNRPPDYAEEAAEEGETH